MIIRNPDLRKLGAIVMVLQCFLVSIAKALKLLFDMDMPYFKGGYEILQ